MKPLKKDFFKQKAPIVAKKLIGKCLTRAYADGSTKKFIVTATEAYFGEEDKGCHASKGRTPRTEVMFGEAGLIYVYLIYGIHWLFNVVTGAENHPEAVLICGLDEVQGSGRVGKLLQIDKSFYGENIFTSNFISFWEIENSNTIEILEKPRVGIDYAGEWKNKLWRFEMKKE